MSFLDAFTSVLSKLAGIIRQTLQVVEPVIEFLKKVETFLENFGKQQ